MPWTAASGRAWPMAVGALAAWAAWLSYLAPAARADDGPPLLKDGVPLAAVLDIDDGQPAMFRVNVPKDAVLLKIALTKSPLPLDILASKDQAPASAEEAEHQSPADPLDNSLRVSRQSRPELDEGTYYVGVTYLGVLPAVVHKRPVKKVPFTITASLVRAKTDGALVPGRKTIGQVCAEEGSVRTYSVEVPAGAKALRIDLDEVSSDLDILARYGEPAIRNEDAGDAAISPLGRESLVIHQRSPQPLKPGRWYVHVVHPLDAGTADFAIYASLAPDPPPALLAIPALPLPADSRKRAIQATVDISTEYGGASGTLLTEDGLVLTNHHVVAEVAEPSPDAEEKDPVVIGVTLHPQDPPRELFRGRVVRFDKTLDLALVQITRGFYHQELPRGYRFPSVPLGDSSTLEIGDRVSIVGFPSVGGTGGRVSVTFTQGVVSGFEKTPAGMLMKTDANIGPGSSGGAALDGQGRLIGVPTSENVMPEVVGRMSYIHPVSLIPEAWRGLIRSSPAGEGAKVKAR